MTCTVVAIDELDFVVAPRPWRFAEERRAEIDAYFAARRRLKPHLWNGRVLLMSRCTFAGRALRGQFFETDFASFLAWREWDFPDRSIVNCFAMGVLRAGDGAFLLGEMNVHTANAGLVYFPCGTPDPSDIRDGRVDFLASVVREVAEETGLSADDFTMEPVWQAVSVGRHLALMRMLQTKEPAEVLRRRIREYLGREEMPELADMRIVRGPTDLDPMMPDVVTAYLSWMWR